MQVSVDADDLEVLLFSTGAIKDMEHVLKARERDPLVKSAASRLTDAHDRVTGAWRRAKRPEPEAPTAEDIVVLREMFNGPSGPYGEPFAIAYLKKYPTRLAQTLQLVESGPAWSGTKIDWPSSPEFLMGTHDAGNLIFGARLTDRGRQVLQNAPVVYALGTSTGADKARYDRLLADSMKEVRQLLARDERGN